MDKQLKVQWTIWIVLFFIVSIGTYFKDFLSTPVILQLVLKKNHEASATLFRLQPEKSPHFVLEFKRTENPSEELGEYSSVMLDEHTIHFNNPGEPIKISVKVDSSNENFLYEALPAGGHTQETITRDMIAFKPNRDAHIFIFRPTKNPSLFLPRGTSHLIFKVIDVGKKLEGETISLIIGAPLSFKFMKDGYLYEIIWWFYFWPFYAFLLSVYGLILLIFNIIIWKRKTRNQH